MFVSRKEQDIFLFLAAGIATCNGPGLEPRFRRDFPDPSRTAPRPAQPHVQCVLGPLPVGYVVGRGPLHPLLPALGSSLGRGRLRLKCDGTRAETRFRLSAKRTSPFKSAGASVQSNTGSRGVRISGSNVAYTMFRGSVKGTGYPLHSPVSPFTSHPVRHRVPSHFNWTLHVCFPPVSCLTCNNFIYFSKFHINQFDI